MCIFFLHIPKTAGQSFRKAAVEYFGKERSLLLYGEDAATTTPAANLIFHKDIKSSRVERFSSLATLIEKENITFFSSHASATALPNFNAENAALFVRDPIQRLISHYNYAIKKKHTTESFETFIENPSYQNLHSAILRKVPIESIKFIGLTERYNESIALFNTIFKTQLKVHHLNKIGFFSKKVQAKKVPMELENRIRELNQKDFILYEKAKKIYAERMAAYGLI